MQYEVTGLEQLVGACTSKKRYFSAGEARQSLRWLKRDAKDAKHAQLVVYRCQHGCDMWHIGSRRTYRIARDGWTAEAGE